MNTANSVRTSDPTSVADVPARRSSIQKSNSKPAKNDDTTNASAFEHEFTEAKRANDGQQGVTRATQVAGKNVNAGSDADTRQNDGTSASQDGAVDANSPAAASNNPLGVAWVGQISQNMSGLIPLQPSGDTAVPINNLQEKSTAALAAARDLLLQRDVTIDDAADQPAANETSIAITANKTHWLFDAPGSQNNRALHAAAGTGSVESVLASILSGETAKTPISGDAGETGKTPEKSGTKNTALQKSALTQQPITAVPASQDQSSGGSGDRPAARDQTFKPAEKISVLPNAGVQSAEPIASNIEAPQTPGAMVVQQVRASIVDAMHGDAPATPQSNAPAFAPDRPLGTGQVLRTIDLTLEPPDLGAVKLRLSLKSNALTIDAEASKASTAKLLNDDRDTLEKSLRTSGYDVSVIRVTDASSTSGTMLGSGSSFQDGSQARSAYAGREQSNFQQRSGNNAQQQDRHAPGEQRQNRPSPSESTAARPANAVYI